jgi:mRNA interferase MazF
MTSELSDARDFRVTIEPSSANGLRVKSQVVADKPVTIRRERIGHLATAISLGSMWRRPS